MFKIGDRVIYANKSDGIKHLTLKKSYIVDDSNGYLVNVKNDVDVSFYYNSRAFEKDNVYYRKQKIKQLEQCSMLEIK